MNNLENLNTLRQANHHQYLWSEGTQTMWLACSWHTNKFHLEFTKHCLPEGIWDLIMRVNDPQESKLTKLLRQREMAWMQDNLIRVRVLNERISQQFQIENSEQGHISRCVKDFIFDGVINA